MAGGAVVYADDVGIVERRVATVYDRDANGGGDQGKSGDEEKEEALHHRSRVGEVASM